MSKRLFVSLIMLCSFGIALAGFVILINSSYPAIVIINLFLIVANSFLLQKIVSYRRTEKLKMSLDLLARLVDEHQEAIRQIAQKLLKTGRQEGA